MYSLLLYVAYPGCVLAYMGTRWKQELEIVCMFKSMDPVSEVPRLFNAYHNMRSVHCDGGL